MGIFQRTKRIHSSTSRAASACGINALFMEVHDNPAKAKSDPNTVLNFKYLEKILIMAKSMHQNRIKLSKELGKLHVI